MTLDDRLYRLLPAIYRQRDEELGGPAGGPLFALLGVIAEQAGVVEQDIAQLYENWFIETCEDWVVPYIGDLVGYTPVSDGVEPAGSAAEQRLRERCVIPRREVANTIANRRRKGTLAVLEALAKETAGWPARAVEVFKLLGWTQPVNSVRLNRGRTLDLRDNRMLELLGGPFERAAHTVNVNGFNIPSVDLFVWRLNSYPVTRTQASCIDNQPNCYTFSILGNNAPLYNNPRPDPRRDHVADELEVPVPIRREIFEVRGKSGKPEANPEIYGPGKSILVAVGEPEKLRVFTAQEVIPADLTHWRYSPPYGKIAIDPHLGRIAFHAEEASDVWVWYRYGFSAAMGGGEYKRRLSQHADAVVIQVGRDAQGNVVQFDSLGDALREAGKHRHAVVEIVDSRLYEESIRIVLPAESSLQIRAANHRRPVIQIPDRRTGRDSLRVDISADSRFILDGLLISGRSVLVTGHGTENHRPDVIIRDCTLVPGWMIDIHCKATDADQPSLELRDTSARIRIERSILGSIEVTQNELTSDPVPVCISDSIVDATSDGMDAISSEKGCGIAYTLLTIARSTVIGHVHVHQIELAENCIFHGAMTVARRQTGCMRFCYVPPGSRTPRRYECEPDKALGELASALGHPPDDQENEAEKLRVVPHFNATHYGSPVYCQLALDCAPEITAGADDESEMGAFHDLFQPQRAANLRQRIQEYVPSSAAVSIIYAS